MTDQEFFGRFCSQFNPAQCEAVRSVDGPVALLAVPGSGKTTVLVARLGYMVCCRKIRPEQILTMTYTVSATNQMRSRCIALFGKDCVQAIEYRTINGLSYKIIEYCAMLTGRIPFGLVEQEGELSGLVTEIYRDLNEEYPSESTIREIRTEITFIKNQMMEPDAIMLRKSGIRNMAQIYERYCACLRENKRMDYDDQMLYALTILRKYPAILDHFQNQYRYICVDEAQDTSRIQHEIVRLLAQKHRNLFMVGDEDQSIYGFRAAYPDALLYFESDYPGAKTIMMENNYRSAASILETANDFVSRNQFRHEKKMIPVRNAGRPVQIITVKDRKTQFDYLFALAQNCRDETAVLYRNHDSAVPLIDLLERNGIAYNACVFDEVFFCHRILVDLEDIIRFSEEQENTERFLRIYYKLNCGISKEAAVEACRRSIQSGKPILAEIQSLPELSSYATDKVQDLCRSFRELPRDNAEDALARICSEMGYREYLRQNHYDEGKMVILALLARFCSSALALLDRLAQLRSLIANHENAPGNRLTISTIHSAKGLEYKNVFLLDVIDGILPGRPEQSAKTQEEIRNYQEERRLFYVAMTRAKDRLSLFAAKNAPSAFVAEVQQFLGAERWDAEDALSFLKESMVGKRYQNLEGLTGRIAAHSDDGVLIDFCQKLPQWMTLQEMVANRARKMTTMPQEQNPAAQGLPPIQNTIETGAMVTHTFYGDGVVERMDLEIISIRFTDGTVRSFLKSSVLPDRKVRLRV